MRPRPLAQLAETASGTVVPDEAGSTIVRGVEVDSRRIVEGALFVALTGEHSDGHRYSRAAIDAGAAAVMVRSGASEDDIRPRLEVEDTARVLLELGRDERASSSATVVGITGSTGKTCTKDFTAAVLGATLRTAASRASFNNEVGLPLTILGAPPDAEAIVCEMGSRGKGHIRLLCDVARPNVGVVTNVGVAHMELFGSPDVLRDAKAELPEALPPDGVAVLNADDAVVRGYAERTRANVVFFGSTRDAHVIARDVTVGRDDGRAAFEVVTPSGAAGVRLPAAGEHLVPDALAALAVGWALGVPLEDAARAIERTSLSGRRMDVTVTAGGWRLVDDSYNANPTSMHAALRAARWMAGDGRVIAALGHMAELGPISAEEHERVGELAARLGIDEMVVVGPEAAVIAAAAEREGVEPDRIVRAGSVEDAADVVRRLVRPGDVVLVKGSRVAGLDRLAAALRDGEAVAP